jgi:hypothetical protein
MRLISALFLVALVGCASSPPVGDVAVSVAAPDFHPGENWTYRLRDGYNGEVQRSFREEVQRADNEAMSTRSVGERITGSVVESYTGDGNPVNVHLGRAALPVSYTPYYPAYVFPLEVGGKWQQRFVLQQAGGRRINASLYGRVVAWEHVSVPAGEFDALRINRQVYLDDEEFWRTGTVVDETDWYVPAIGRYVKHEDSSQYFEKSARRGGGLRRGDWTIVELQAFQPARK